MASSIPYISQEKVSKVNSLSTKPEKGTSLAFTVPELDKAISYFGGGKPKLSSSRTTIRQSNQRNYEVTGISSDSNWSLDTIVSKLNTSVNLSNPTDTRDKSFMQMVNQYNRFKVPNPNLPLIKGYSHVFFVRPDCYLFEGNKIRDSILKNETFQYMAESSPNLFKELTINSGNGTPTHDFMLSLSNFAASFSLKDEYIKSDVYGKTFTGYSIAYGKNGIDSKTSDEFEILYNDDRNLHIYQLHRIWVEYINAVYRGIISPKPGNIRQKILDYATSCYYIMTAEDGETILFWSKYYGVFPTTIPSNQYTWGAGNAITNPQVSIRYQYSFKEDFNTYTIAEFNYNSHMNEAKQTYVPIYDKDILGTGTTWVGAPFIERVVTSTANGNQYVYKLRFKK